MRRSMLFLPGNNPDMLINVGALGADAIIYDLEDAVSTTGKDIDVLVTQGGIAVNPKNADLTKNLKAAGLPVIDIHELKEKTEHITGTPSPLPEGDRVVAQIISRTGELPDNIYNVVG